MLDLLDVHTHTIASVHAYSTIREMAEAAKGKGLKLSKALAPYLTFVLPVLIAIILIAGLLPS